MRLEDGAAAVDDVWTVVKELRAELLTTRDPTLGSFSRELKAGSWEDACSLTITAAGGQGGCGRPVQWDIARP